MKNISLYRQLQRVQHALKQETLKTQDAEITEFYNQLEESPERLLPSFLYPLLVDVLTYYGREILPALNLSVEDNQYNSERLDQSIHRLQVQEKTSKDLEARFRQMLLRVKSGTLVSIEDVVAIFCGMVRSGNIPGSAGILPASGKADVPSAFDAGKMPALPGYTLRDLEKQYRTLKKSAFTSKHALPFFEALVSRAFPEEVKDTFARMQELFWHQLHELLQMKAVLVNILNQEALITRLDVTTCLEQAGLDDLQFDNNVDEKMYQSCWNALRAARIFLERHFPDSILGAQASCLHSPLEGGVGGCFPLLGGAGVGSLKHRSLHVTCRFPNPSAEYNDTSASLLVGLKIVGDVLDLEIDPHTAITGEVDSAGRILPVDHIAEKVTAAEHHPDICHIYLPHYGFVVRTPRITVTPVRTFAEAVEGYYGEQFRKKLRQVSRRQMIKGAIALATVPLGLGLFTFKNIFTHPVSDEDRLLLDYAQDLYQKHSEHQKATEILQRLLSKFARDTSSTDVVRFKAKIFTELGLNFTQQHNIRTSLVYLQKAFNLWQSLHNREQQVQALLSIGSVYYHSVVADGIKGYGKTSLHYLEQAHSLLHPSMQMFAKIFGDYYGILGSLYDALNAHREAQTAMEKSIEYLEEAGTEWSYHLSNQCLGRILVRLGQYDKAFTILEDSLEVPVLQRPYNQVRGFRGLSDLYLSIGDYEKGLEFAVKSEKLCQKLGLQGQHIVLQKMLLRHQLSSNIISSL